MKATGGAAAAASVGEMEAGWGRADTAG